MHVLFHLRCPVSFQRQRAQITLKSVALTLFAGLLLALTADAQETHFLPGHLAVLRAGDGEFSLNLKQSPVFVDQFDTNGLNAAPSLSVRIPTNGPNSFFFNGHAATEGILTRSADHKLLAFAGYGGVDLLQVSGTASRLDIKRGFVTVDHSGAVHTYLYKTDIKDGKLNPRGVATDGTNNFWGCGNTFGTFYYNPTDGHEPARFGAFPNSRAVKIISNTLYVSMNTADGYSGDQPAGVYTFLPAALPRLANAPVNLVIPAAADFKKTAGFDMNSGGTIAYMADTAAGIQKYVKSDGKWTLAYNFSIPQNIPKDLNTSAGCFGLAVDFSGAAPIIYATTTEGYGGSVNSNRVVRIVDTSSNAVVNTLVQSGSTNIAYRGIDFTPE
ncbi:MAG: hypothetical protein JWQ04_1746 [Pedosphaera sp.]|nr:hypothetical protein [Pedosphaera sp.]